MKVAEVLEEASEPIQALTLLDHVKERRVEILLGAVLLHLMGAFNWASTQAQGVC